MNEYCRLVALQCVRVPLDPVHRETEMAEVTADGIAATGRDEEEEDKEGGCIKTHLEKYPFEKLSNLLRMKTVMNG